MIAVAHWLASFVVLSVALAHLEGINVITTPVATWLTRAVGWTLIGLSGFDGIIGPFFGHGCAGDKLGIIGFAVCAVAYRWDGASRYEGVKRRANDH